MNIMHLLDRWKWREMLQCQNLRLHWLNMVWPNNNHLILPILWRRRRWSGSEMLFGSDGPQRLIQVIWVGVHVLRVALARHAEPGGVPL